VGVRRFKRQLHVAVVVLIVVVIGYVMHHKKMKKRNRMIQLFCFLEMLDNDIYLQHLFKIDRRKQVNGEQKYGSNFFQRPKGKSIKIYI